MSMRRCDTCRYFDADDETCRRNAPTVFPWLLYGLALAVSRNDEEAEHCVGEHGPNATWPSVHTTDWCGEWRARDD